MGAGALTMSLHFDAHLYGHAAGHWPRAGAAATARTQTDKMDTRAKGTFMADGFILNL